MVYRRTKHLSRTALRFVAALPLFYKTLNSSENKSNRKRAKKQYLLRV